MSSSRFGGVLMGLLAVCGLPAVGLAQVTNLGSRAQGMAGAFVAVADDASAVYWNPAGLGAAIVVGGLFDLSRHRVEPDGTPGDAASGTEAFRQDGRLFAVALPQLGLSYYRLRHAGVRVGAAGMPANGREIEGRGVSYRTLDTSHLGVTLLQSLTDGVVVGTTVRYVRGGAAVAEGRRQGDWGDLVDEAAGLDGDDDGYVDVDAGVMVSAGRVRLGLVVHNLREPSFELADGSGSIALNRHARVGVAYGAGWPGYTNVVVAVDADLTRAVTFGEDRRDVAAGIEGWGFDRRLGVRGGVRASTVGDVRPVGSVGFSVGVTSGLFLDAHLARGREGRDHAWSVGGRISY